MKKLNYILTSIFSRTSEALRRFDGIGLSSSVGTLYINGTEPKFDPGSRPKC